MPSSNSHLPIAKLPTPKIAIVHDWLTNLGGAERVVLSLKEAFPQADIFTSVYEPDKLLSDTIGNLPIQTTWLQKLPRPLRKFHKLFPMLRVKAFRDLDLSAYDIIISSSSAESKQVRKTRDGQVHICYCHTPIRYYWVDPKSYMKDPGLGWLNWPARIGFWLMKPALKRADYRAAQAVDTFVANSTEVQKRIKQYYDRDSVVVHPPVQYERFASHAKRLTERSYYLAHGRQVLPYKTPEIAIRACNELKLPLIVSGGGPDHERLKSIAGPTIRFEHFPTDECVSELFGAARGYIFPIKEDFGIVQVEALAAGTPVIAYAHGGSEDIIRDGEGGVTFEPRTTKALVAALQRFETMQFQPAAMQRLAKRFHKNLFIQKMKKVVNDNYR
ncbi:MAG: glycosyltransferase [Candidatus Saccharimonadales bacterium]